MPQVFKIGSYYVTPFTNLSKDEEIDISFCIPTDSEIWPEGSITIPAMDKMVAQTYSADGLTASISPVGMMLSYGFNEGLQKPAKDITIHYTDRSEYVVRGENVENISVSSYAADSFDTVWISFNRLADPDNISEIHISGYSLDETETRSDYDLILTGTN